MGAVGALMTSVDSRYRALRKPALRPPDWLFGPAWTLILGLAAWSAVIAWEASANEAERIRVVALFGFNAVCHLLWSPLFFRLRRPDWAFVEVVFLWLSLVALIAGLWPISHMAALLLVPYFAWVSFAAWLNRWIARMNGPFG